VDPRAGLDDVEKILDPTVIQPAASCYTDSDIQADAKNYIKNTLDIPHHYKKIPNLQRPLRSFSNSEKKICAASKFKLCPSTALRWQFKIDSIILISSLRLLTTSSCLIPRNNRNLSTKMEARSDQLPITVPMQSVFAHLNTGIVGSNPTGDMDVCVRLFCVLFRV
jgi:hypothetical protein